MKKRAVSMIMALIMFFSCSNIAFASTDDRVLKEEKIEVGNVTVDVKTEIHDAYVIVNTEDSDGNTASYDTRNKYIVENGKKIYVSMQKEEIIPENTISTRKASDWRKIRSYRHTIKFEKAVRTMSVAAITAYIRPIYSIGASLLSVIAENIKSKYKTKGLTGSKTCYIQTDVFGYIFTTSREAYKRYALDAKKKKISGTTFYSDSAIKGI